MSFPEPVEPTWNIVAPQTLVGNALFLKPARIGSIVFPVREAATKKGNRQSEAPQMLANTLGLAYTLGMWSGGKPAEFDEEAVPG